MHALSPAQIETLTALRHALHRAPEVSGDETRTARRIASELKCAGADRLWRGLGGHGVAAEFIGPADGPTVLIRCELDALPIHEQTDLPYRSSHPGTAHLCGHDGHMAMVVGVALGLARRPARGRVVLLFQPAEETGAGAKAVISDPHWPQIRPDFAFAIHNLPGWPLGRAGVADGTACCASRGMQVLLHGKSSHAAAPEDGLSPAGAVARLIPVLGALGPGGALTPDFALSTLTHARIGAPSFGIAPGEAELRVTLRSVSDARMEQMIAQAQDHVAGETGALQSQVLWHDVFPATVNDPQAAGIARDSAAHLGLRVETDAALMRWSEDFAHYGLDGAQTALILLGAGEAQPQLHNPDYDFPDALIAPGAALLLGIVDRLLGRANAVSP